MNKQLQQKLLRLAKQDQTMRKVGPWDTQIDKRNTTILKKIVVQHGWPTIPMVGKRASDAAWLLVQHADHDVSFQKKCLKLMTAPKTKKNISLFTIAYLTDRLRVNEGKKQIYGTQFYRTKNRRFIPRPIYDTKNLGARRKEFGLESFEKYRKKLEIRVLRKK